MTYNKKLSTRIGMMVSIILTFTFVIFIGITVLQVKAGLDNVIIGELQEMSKANGLMVSQIMDAAKTVTDDMNSYLQTTNKNKLLSSQIYTKQSEVISNLKLSDEAYNIENYLISTASSAVSNNGDIVGAGAYFEPYSFSANAENYSIYVDYSTGKVEIKDRGDYSTYSQGPIYQQTVNAGQTIFSNPYTDSVTGVLMITVSKPIIFEGKTQGIVFVDISISRFDEINVKNDRYPTLCYSIIADDGTIAYYSEHSDLVGSKFVSTFKSSKDNEKVIEQIDSNNDFYIKCKDSDNKNVYRFFYPITAGNGTWAVASTLDAKDVNETTTKTTLLMIIIAIIALIFIVVVIIIILKKMLSPINNIVEAAKEISHGNLDINIQVNSDNEIGLLAATFSDTIAYLKRMIGEISNILGSIAHNNLDVSITEEYLGNFGRIKSSLDNIISNLNNVMSNIGESSNHVSESAKQVATGAQMLASGTNEQAGSIERLTEAINRISEQIRDSADNAAKASTQASTTGSAIEESNNKMNQLIAAISKISDFSLEISKIANLIEDIASQTNMLSLNAEIEAARAGEAGKGFSVVANEVRDLANKSSEAAQSATKLINNSIKAVENGTKIAYETATALDLVVNDVKETVDTIERISSAANIQATSVVEITQSMEAVSGVVQTNSATAQQSAAASEQLAGLSQNLQSLVGQFSLKNN